MKKIEIIAAVLFLIAIVLRVFNIPGGIILVSLSLKALAMIYFILSFALFNNIPLKKIFEKESYTGISISRIIRTFGLGFALSLIFEGILFRIMNYPGAMLMLLTGVVLTIAALIVSLVKYLKIKSVFYKRVIIRTAIVGIFGVTIAIMSDLAFEKVQYWTVPEYIEALENYYEAPHKKENQIAYSVERLRLAYDDDELNFYLKNNMEALKELMIDEEIEYYVERYKEE